MMLGLIVLLWGEIFYFKSPLALFDGTDMMGEVEMNQDAYLFQIFGVCSLLIGLPLVLKWMTLNFVRKKIVGESLGVYTGYVVQCEYRTYLLSTTFVFNAISYMHYPQTTPIFCAAIAFIGMAFCYPSRERMDYELNFIEGEVDEDGKIKGK